MILDNVNLDIPFSGLVRIQYHMNSTLQVNSRMRNFMKTVAKSRT